MMSEIVKTVIVSTAKGAIAVGIILAVGIRILGTVYSVLALQPVMFIQGGFEGAILGSVIGFFLGVAKAVQLARTRLKAK